MVFVKKLIRFPVVMTAVAVLIAAWWAGFIIPEIIADVKADVVSIGKLPDGYKLSKTERTNDGITYFYKSKDGGHITLHYLPDTELSLKGYLESQGVYAKYTTVIPSRQGMMCMYIYSKEGENVGVVDPGDGLFIMSGNIGSYELGEAIRTVSIKSSK